MAEENTTEGAWGEDVSIDTKEQEATKPIDEAQVVEEVKTEITSEDIPKPLEQEVIKERIVEVEKLIEKYPEFKDDYSKQLYESILSGDDKVVKNYLDEKYKDYQTMSDFDVVREKLKRDNPRWNDRDVSLEMKHQYGDIPERIDISLLDKDEDGEAYNNAVKLNDDIDRKEALLSIAARDARYDLEDQKKNIELPKIAVSEKQENPQMDETALQEQIAERDRIWDELVDAELPKLSEIKFSVDNEDVVYKINDDDNKAFRTEMKNFNYDRFIADRGWVDENMNPNMLKIAEDVHKLTNMDKIIKSVAAQMKTSAKRDVISKDIKNISIDGTTSAAAASPESLGDFLWGL